MFRKLVALAIGSAVILMTMTSCGLDYRYSLDENLHNKIQHVRTDNDQIASIIYNGVLYKPAGTTDFFGILRDDNDVKLSWNGYRYIWYINEFYSYDTDNPLFIYFARSHAYYVYFREDYDYKKDVFTIDGFDNGIVFENIMASKSEEATAVFDSIIASKTEDSGIPNRSVRLRSKTNDRIEICLWIALSEGKLYLRFDYTHDYGERDIWTAADWIATDEFYNYLVQTGIIIEKVVEKK